jgi:hypothetical protein
VTASLREQTASTNDNLIGVVVGMPLVADVIEPSDVHTIARALRPARRQHLFKSVGRVEVIGNEAG